MADTGKAMGKHAALRERMRAKKGPQMIHCSRPTTEASKEIPMSITMSPESAKEDELLGTYVINNEANQDPSTWAMMDYGAAEEAQKLEDLERKEPRDVASFLGTSFMFASTQDQNVAMQYDTLGNVLTPMKKSTVPDFENGLTPGVCWKQWQQEEVYDGDVSLLQKSMIVSDESSSVATPQNQTMLSVASLAPMTPGMVLTASPTSPLTAMRRNSMHQALEESNVYVRRIHELEEALRSANAKDAGKDRNVASPQECTSPLMERNKTLVKEVRFAEQTCVELSQRNAALEQDVRRLELHLEETRKENECLHDEIVQSSRECATLLAQKEALEVALEEEREQREADFELSQSQLSESQMRLEMRRLRGGDENREPNVTPKKSARSALSGSPTSQVLAKTLRTQLERGYSDSDKILELESKLTESQNALSEARRDLESVRAQERDRSTLLGADTSNCSMSTELELARSQAKLASVSKELQVLRVAESSARHALTQAKVQLGVLQKEKDEPRLENPRREGVRQNEIDELKATVQKLTQDCHDHKEAARHASNRATVLQQELLQSKKRADLETERLCEAFFNMTQRALGKVERQSRLLDEKMKSKTEEFASRLHSMSSAVHLLQNSLDFQSESSSCAEEDGHTLDSLSRSGESVNDDQGGCDEVSTDETVLNATIHPSPNATQSMHEEMLLEQMEEARLVDRSADSSAHENIEGLSLIHDMSHLYEDLSALLSNEPISPAREPDTMLQKSLQDLKSEANTSAGGKSTVHNSLESVEEECLQLRSILERTQRAATGGNHVLLETIDDQSRVIQSLERKLRAFADEADRIEDERRQLNLAVSEMSKSYTCCQSELREISEALKASQESEVEARSDMQQALEKLIQELEEKERSIAVLRREKAELAGNVRELSSREDATLHIKLEQTLEKLLQKLQEKERSITLLHSEKEVLASKVCDLSSGDATLRDRLNIATIQVDELQREIEGKVQEVEKGRLRSAELSSKIQSLESLRKKDERRIEEMQEAAMRSESEKLQLDRFKAEREDDLRISRALSETVEELTNSKAELLAEVEQLQSAVFTLECELKDLKVFYLTANDKLADASERNTNKDAIVDKFRSANRAAKEMVASSEESLAQAKAELEELEADRKILEERVVALERDLMTTSNDFAAYERSVEEKLAEQNELIEIMQSTATSEEILAQAKMELEESLTERKRVEERVVALERELVATTDDFAAYERSTVEKLAERNELIEMVQSTAEALKSTYEHKMSSLTREHDARIEQVHEAVAEFVTEFLAAYSQSQELLMRLGVTFSDADFNSKPGVQSWIENIKVASEQIPRWKHLVAACYEIASAHQRQLEEAEDKVENLASKMYRSNDTETKIEAELREQHDRSVTLANDLRLAEVEAAESAREIAETSKALVDTKKELARLYRLVEDQRDLKHKTEELIRERDDAESRSVVLSKTLASLNQKLEEATNAS
jgi:chromosome segregation ATPase